MTKKKETYPRWQKEPPTEEGWYWVIEHEKEIIVEVIVCEDYVSTVDWTREYFFDVHDKRYSRWLGPLPSRIAIMKGK